MNKNSVDIGQLLELRRLVDVLYDVQDIRIREANRLRQMPKETGEIYVDPFLELEKQLTAQIERRLAQFPIYTEWLSRVKGIGPRIAGCIIAQTMLRFVRVDKKILASHLLSETHGKSASQNVREAQRVFAHFTRQQLELAQKTKDGDYLVPDIRGIGAFDTISKYWAWWGLHTVNGWAPKRQRGVTVNWNPKMRTLSWKIARQFVLQGDYYRKVYEAKRQQLMSLRLPPRNCPRYQECKAKLKKSEKPACKGHVNAMARRFAVKLFVSHLWLKWRKLEGLPIRQPYVIDKLGHTTIWEVPYD